MHILFPTELEKLLNIIGEAANRLRARIELNYKTRIDVLGRKFCGLHDTVLPLAGAAKTIFQQLRKKYGRSKRKQQTHDEGVQEERTKRQKSMGRRSAESQGLICVTCFSCCHFCCLICCSTR